MVFLKNLSIRAKLLLVTLIPLLALIYLLTNFLETELKRKQTSTRVYSEFEEVSRVSTLIHELQKERGIVLTYLFSKSAEDRNQLTGQQTLTDKQVISVRSIYNQHRKLSPILPILDKIGQYREDLATYPDTLNMVKAALLNEIHAISRGSENAEIKNRLEAHLFLLYSKEYLARIRSILMPNILDGQFRGYDLSRFASRKGQYELNLAKFKETAPPDLQDFFAKRFSGSAVKMVHQYIDSLYYNPALLGNMEADEWWVNATAAVNSLSETEQFSLDKIKERAESELAAINRSVWFSVSLALAVIVVITLILAFTIKHIVSSIREIKTAAERMSQGDTDFTVPANSEDEIGNLASSFNHMIRVSKAYAEVAERIGEGDYTTEAEVRGKSDTLGIALNRMKSNLLRLSEENRKRTWLLMGNNRLNDAMRGDKDLHVLTQDIINELAAYTSAQIGALYIRENGVLKWAGGYATDPVNTKKQIHPGQGFIGQVALTAKPIILNEIPDDYYQIQSALGQTRPRNLIVFPVMYENEVKGVLEFGSVSPFAELDQELLKLVGNNIGIAVNAAQARARLKQLLEETQRQAEELESQQEELRQFNEELQEKTTLLEKSEEELKAQQEELQQTNEELEEKANLLEDQKQALEFARFQIEEKVHELQVVSKYKTDFLANMSHELRTPLNSILILSQVLLENAGNGRSGKDKELIQTIYHAGNDLLQLINEILDLSKIEAGKMEMHVDDFVLTELSTDMNTMFREVAKSKGIHFNIDISESAQKLIISSDKQRIGQIIKNFLSNAFKFTEPGGDVRLMMDVASPGTIFNNDQLNNAAQVVSFTVSDTGVGIAAEKMAVIFEAFQQGDSSSKRRYGGTGLGLSICRELAIMLGGEIQVSSKPGEGSSFAFYLPSFTAKNTIETSTPRMTGSSVQAPGETTGKVAATSTARIADDVETVTEADRKILIIEDDEQFAGALLRFVRERNYKGIVAHDGLAGLNYAGRYKPDVILLDMKLPGMSGRQVLRQLKADPALRHIPVQIISGYDERRIGLQHGALDFVRKPISKETFREVMDRIEKFVARKPKKLLIVEDDQLHNLAVKELIGNGDVVCFSAYSGKEGLDMLQRDHFDCIVMDLGLPDMTGFDFLQTMRQNETLLKIPVIVYTGRTLSKEDNQKLEMLANTVVLKTAQSHERLLDETTLFLHRIESSLPGEKQRIIRKLHKTNEVLKNKKVLIADDDARNVWSLVIALEQEGMHCISAENGKAALEILTKDPDIDIVLMDVMMPEMDGYEATRAIRNLPAYQNVPIIALTAKAMKGDREKCLQAGMSDYASKPLNIQQLMSLIRVWLYGQ